MKRLWFLFAAVFFRNRGLLRDADFSIIILSGINGRGYILNQERRLTKQERQQRLLDILDDNAFLTDEELSARLGVSVPTIRLDRMELGLPEVRERVKQGAAANYGKVRALGGGELVGELLDLELGVSGISLLEITPEMVLSRSGIARGHHLFAQANSLAVAVIDAEVALTGSARIRFLRPVKLGERVVAKGTVVVRRKFQYLVQVNSRVGAEEVFRGRFVIFTRIGGKRDDHSG
jgi:acyl-coenzyme A thioesterase PaaI-like protein